MIRLTALASMTLMVLIAGPSSARDVGPDCIRSNLHQTFSDCYVPGEVLGALWATAPTGTYYRVTPICAAAPDHPDDSCVTVQLHCTDPPDSYRYWLWRSVDGSPFEPIASTCLREGDSGEFEVITPGKVFREMEKLDWPEAGLAIQPPDGRTLVNLPTNFFTTTTEPVSQTMTLLGQQVVITAEPVGYTWHFGDGTNQSGADPGAEYPDLRITHVYAKAGVTVSPWVDVTYHGSYTVNGGDPRDIPEELTVVGTPVDLEVLTATPHLVG